MPVTKAGTDKTRPDIHVENDLEVINTRRISAKVSLGAILLLFVTIYFTYTAFVVYEKKSFEI
jgi:hypothetical protein